MKGNVIMRIWTKYHPSNTKGEQFFSSLMKKELHLILKNSANGLVKQLQHGVTTATQHFVFRINYEYPWPNNMHCCCQNFVRKPAGVNIELIRNSYKMHGMDRVDAFTLATILCVYLLVKRLYFIPVTSPILASVVGCGKAAKWYLCIFIQS